MDTEKSSVRRTYCRNIRSQESYFSDKPFDDNGCHSGIFWCHQTQNGIGPDGQPVDLEECSPTRECFEG